MRKSIYIAYTGGTIGMKYSDNGYVPVANYLTETLAKLPEFHRTEMPEFTINEYNHLIDSSDMSPQDWQTIAEDIQKQYAKYDGFIILHGTDTMAYTASALSFMFENLQKPVIITGSQIPLAQLRSDGQANLLNALYIAANYPIPEVTLFFNNRLFRGNRVRKVDSDGFNAFDSPNYPILLEAGIHIETDYPIDKSDIAVSTKTPLQVTQIEPQPIGLVSLYPGFNPDILENVIQQPVNALILMSYGVGNAPQQQRLLDLLKAANDREILVVNCTQCLRGKVDMTGYANGKLVELTGVVSGQDLTPEAALAKLHYLLSQSDLSFQQRRALFSKSLRGELDEPVKS